MTRFARARAKALAAGATDAEIAAAKPPSNPIIRRNMIRALQLHPWLNTKADWVRLAGALNVRP